MLAIGCQEQAARMGKGFRLPTGDEERGKTAFIGLNCHQCHSVASVELPKSDSPTGIAYELGGEVRQVKSYGELVTAITQPQHILSAEWLARIEKSRTDGLASPMPDFNDRMTVSQLTDIVTFLHAHYQKAAPPGMSYPNYLP
jgi:mono/diheme cytochrome c family protein